MENKPKTSGIRSIFVFVPTIIAIGILYIFIIVSTIYIYRFTEIISVNTQTTNEIVDVIGDLQSGSSKLSATAISFTHTPTVGPMKALNEAPLKEYLTESLIEEKKTPVIRKKLEAYNLDDDTMELINQAIESANYMLSAQAHAFKLIDSVSYISIGNVYFSLIDDYVLSTDEENMSDEEKLSYAFEILLSKDYSAAQGQISQSTRQATKIINDQSIRIQNEYTWRLRFARGFLWTSILFIILANIILFLVLFMRLIFPIRNFSRRIDENQRLDVTKGLYEANHLATAYNNLLDRHKEYEKILKNVAEIDSLTGLQNRYCYNEFLKETITVNKSTCVFLLDINNLKYVNDTYGHFKGDELIKTASQCIKECFLKEDGKNCYRIGGDEFVAILDNISKDSIESYLTHFTEKQQELGVSIAIGYSYSDNVKTVGYEKLLIEADKQMYKNKNEVYKNQNTTFIN